MDGEEAAYIHSKQAQQAQMLAYVRYQRRRGNIGEKEIEFLK
jgi:hypothetical protein